MIKFFKRLFSEAVKPPACVNCKHHILTKDKYREDILTKSKDFNGCSYYKGKVRAEQLNVVTGEVDKSFYRDYYFCCNMRLNRYVLELEDNELCGQQARFFELKTTTKGA